MKSYLLKRYQKHNIIGRGTVLAVRRDENDIENISIGDEVKTLEGNFIITGIESFINNFGEVGMNLGLIIREKNE